MPVASLSLFQLELYDPHAPRGSAQRRFLCPLCNTGRNRNLTVQMMTGKWHCHRCGEGGTLKEWWRNNKKESKNLLTLPTPVSLAHQLAEAEQQSIELWCNEWDMVGDLLDNERDSGHEHPDLRSVWASKLVEPNS